MCLENLRTLVDSDETLCFHLADTLRCKYRSQHWRHMRAIDFCRQARIRKLDKQTYTFEAPVTVREAVSVVHDWSTTNMGKRPLQRTVWQDRRATFESSSM